MRASYPVIVSMTLVINCLIFDHVSAVSPMTQTKQHWYVLAEEAIRERLIQLFSNYSQKANDPRITERVKKLGFDQLGDLQNAKAGIPFEVSIVRLDKLKSYQVGSAPEPLLQRTNGGIFPLLLSEDQVRSSAMVEISRKDQGDEFIIRVTQLGAPNLIKLLTDARKELTLRRGCVGECFVVWIPALKRYFLGDNTSGRFMMKVLTDGPGGDLKKGDFLPAERVFAILQSEAKKDQRYEFPPFNPRFPAR